MNKIRYGFFYGTSMMPEFPTFGLSKDIWYDKQTRENIKANIQVGDVLLYKSKGYTECGNLNNMPSLTAHRLVEMDESCAYLKGDNRQFVEEVAYDKIVGKVLEVWGWKKRVLLV